MNKTFSEWLNQNSGSYNQPLLGSYEENDLWLQYYPDGKPRPSTPSENMLKRKLKNKKEEEEQKRLKVPEVDSDLFGDFHLSARKDFSTNLKKAVMYRQLESNNETIRLWKMPGKCETAFQNIWIQGNIVSISFTDEQAIISIDDGYGLITGLISKAAFEKDKFKQGQYIKMIGTMESNSPTIKIKLCFISSIQKTAIPQNILWTYQVAACIGVYFTLPTVAPSFCNPIIGKKGK
ncbi:DgyrCDS7627 [Dimorphilus gyrociliatus]|uniref:DgyrCDS7627 n=1 Tax=Dimorphilus gyrociliatus TaxID=2664684 RepID=A0A7I8VSK1_9ANNE|nr:DgyrCDS7627 [Dimorphilus gyrociliatus]